MTTAIVARTSTDRLLSTTATMTQPSHHLRDITKAAHVTSDVASRQCRRFLLPICIETRLFSLRHVYQCAVLSSFARVTIHLSHGSAGSVLNLSLYSHLPNSSLRVAAPLLAFCDPSGPDSSLACELLDVRGIFPVTHTGV